MLEIEVWCLQNECSSTQRTYVIFIPDTFKVFFAEIKNVNADVYVQANIKECKKEKKIGHLITTLLKVASSGYVLSLE